MAVTSTNNLRKGSKGSDVTELQKLLNSTGYGYNLAQDGSFGSKTLAAVQDYQKRSGLTVDGIVGTKTWASLTGGKSASTSNTTETKTPTFAYTPSDTVAQAEAMLQQHLANKPGEYQSSWQTQLNDTLQKILNREKFSYDLNGDMLYQQYKDQYTTQGKLASMDVMGQAAAMTGGYGNSYAQTAGQQTYQGYLQQLNDKVPELYQLALNQYNAEGDEMYSQASLMAQMEDQDYGRYRDSVSDYYSDLNYLTENSRYRSETEYERAWKDFNAKYGAYRDTVADQQWQATFDEGVRQFNEQFAYQQKQDKIANNLAYQKIKKENEEKEDDGEITATEATDAFEKKIHPESQHDAIARQMYGSYRNYVDKEIQLALKNGDLTESEAVWLYSKYKIYN